MFRYPSIDYIENEADTTLTANIYLEPKKKYSLSFEPEVNQSNIQTIGFSFSTGLKIRNVFRGAETLEINRQLQLLVLQKNLQILKMLVPFLILMNLAVILD